jgi:hypothetical protein
MKEQAIRNEECGHSHQFKNAEDMKIRVMFKQSSATFNNRAFPNRNDRKFGCMVA